MRANRRRNNETQLAGFDFTKVLGAITGDKSGGGVPVKATVDITPKLSNTLLGFAGIIGGSIVLAVGVSAVAKSLRK